MLRLFRSKRKRNAGKARSTAGESDISEETMIRGSVETKGRLRINGTIHGAVTAKELRVDFEGFVMGEITADTIIVDGTIIGPLLCKHLHLKTDARVEGDIRTSTISIDKGAQLRGAIYHDRDFTKNDGRRPTLAEERHHAPPPNTEQHKEERFADAFAPKLRARG